MKQIFRLSQVETKRSLLTVRLEHVGGAPSATFDVLVSMDETKLRGPVEEERWVLLELLADRINLLLRNHRSQTE